jgi:predicted transcriptional regulator
MNGTRRELFQYICQNPAVHLRWISRALDFSTQTAQWHLRKLISKKLITTSKIGNKKVFYPLSGLINEDECQIMALFYRENVKKIYLHLRNNPKKTQRELVKELNIYQQLLSRALVAMENHNVIYYKMRGRIKIYYITDLMGRLENDFELRTQAFQEMLIYALTADGVDPKIKTTENFFELDIDSGGGERSFIRAPKNPVKALLG